MSWLDLGTINVTTDWQVFPVSAVGGRVFRLTQISSGFDELRRAKKGYLQIKDFYPASEANSNLRFAKARIGPEAKMLNWPVPPDLEAKGIVVRDIYIRRWVFFGRLLVQETATFQVNLEQLA